MGGVHFVLATRVTTPHSTKSSGLYAPVCAATFAGMSLYGYTTKRDLTGWLARYQKQVTNASQGGILSS